MNRSALTLLEVLLALALLTAATAAGASLMQTSRSAAGGSAQRFDAAGVLRRWQADTSRAAADAERVQALEPWSWTDPKGRTWSVVETPAPAPAPGTDTGPVRDDDEQLPTIDWVSIELHCAPSPGAGSELVLRALVPAHAERDARGAP